MRGVVINCDDPAKTNGWGKFTRKKRNCQHDWQFLCVKMGVDRVSAYAAATIDAARSARAFLVLPARDGMWHNPHR